MQSLLTLLRHAQDERDRCAAAWQVAHDAQLALEAQYEQLLTFRHEYEERWSRQFTEHGQIELVRSYHGFMQRLTQALDHQQGTVKAAVTRAAKARVVLREREVRVASVRKLLERRDQQARTDSHRREQKFNDEMASRVVHDSSVQGLASTF